jgi:hypothetical protein
VTRRVFVRRLVLNSICDDGENVDQIILQDVKRDSDKTGVTIDRAEVIDALAQLVAGGLAEAWLLSQWPGKSVKVQGMPPMDVIEENFKTYFFITEKGRKAHLSDDTWYPLDDDGNLRPNWHLDEVQP